VKVAKHDPPRPAASYDITGLTEEEYRTIWCVLYGRANDEDYSGTAARSVRAQAVLDKLPIYADVRSA